MYHNCGRLFDAVGSTHLYPPAGPESRAEFPGGVRAGRVPEISAACGPQQIRNSSRALPDNAPVRLADTARHPCGIRVAECRLHIPDAPETTQTGCRVVSEMYRRPPPRNR